MQHSELCTFRCPWSIDKLFKLIFTYFSNIFIAGSRNSHGASSIKRSESMSEEVRGDSSHGPAETENQNKNDDNEEVRGNSSHDLQEWLQESKDNLVDEGVLREFFSWIIFRVASKNGIGHAQRNYSLPEGPKLRHLLQNQDYKSCLQRTHRYSRAQSGRFWWLDNCGSPSPWRTMWISKQSSIRCRGTRLGNAVVTILPV